MMLGPCSERQWKVAVPPEMLRGTSLNLSRVDEKHARGSTNLIWAKHNQCKFFYRSIPMERGNMPAQQSDLIRLVRQIESEWAAHGGSTDILLTEMGEGESCSRSLGEGDLRARSGLARLTRLGGLKC